MRIGIHLHELLGDPPFFNKHLLWSEAFAIGAAGELCFSAYAISSLKSLCAGLFHISGEIELKKKIKLKKTTYLDKACNI